MSPSSVISNVKDSSAIPVEFNPGKGSVPEAVELGLASMARYERAVISCTAADAAQMHKDSLVAAPPTGAERVEFVLELQQLTQVGAHFGLPITLGYVLPRLGKHTGFGCI